MNERLKCGSEKREGEKLREAGDRHQTPILKPMNTEAILTQTLGRPVERRAGMRAAGRIGLPAGAGMGTAAAARMAECGWKRETETWGMPGRIGRGCVAMSWTLSGCVGLRGKRGGSGNGEKPSDRVNRTKTGLKPD